MNKENIIKKLNRIGYIVSDNGELLDLKGKFISNIVIYPIEQKRKFRNGNIEMYASMNAYVDGGKSTQITLPVIEIEKLQWIPMKLGMHAIVEDKKVFVSILKELFKDVEIVDVYDSTGWIESYTGEYAYLDSLGAIKNNDLSVEIDEHLSNYRFSRKDIILENAAKVSLALLQAVNKRVSYVLMSVVFLCVFLEFIKPVGKLPEFVVWLYGFTGSGKTTIAKLFASHFGEFQNRVTASFNDTYTSIELKTYKLKDSLMLLDDFCPQQSFKESQNLNTIAEKVIRAYGDRTSRGRATNTMESQVQFIPRGMAVITGETIVPGNSTQQRLALVELKAGDVDFERIKEIQKESELLSIVMREYILWITDEVNQDKKDFSRVINSNYEDFLSEIINEAIETHGRTYESFAWLLVGLDMMCQFYCNKGILSQEEGDLLIEEAKSEFLKLIEIKNEQSKLENPMELFLDTVKELIGSQAITLKNLDTQEIIGNQYKPIEGYFDSEFYYFNANNIYGLVRSRLSKAGVYMQLPVRGLIKVLADNDVIRVEEASNQPKKTIVCDDGSKRRQRLLHIRKEFLD